MVSFRNDILPLKDKLFRLALRITLNPADAEDVVQETMIKVWNRRNNWDAIDNIESFCLTVCRNLAVDKTRYMGNQTLSIETEKEPSDDSHHANPEEQPYSATAFDWCANSSTNCLRNSAVVCSFVILRGRAIRT